MKSSALAALLIFLSSCAFVPGAPVPPLGFGPVLDQCLPLLLVGLAAWLLWRFAPGLRRHWKEAGGERQDNAANVNSILRERYVRGEITRDQFLQILEDLGREPKVAPRKQPEQL